METNVAAKNIRVAEVYTPTVTSLPLFHREEKKGRCQNKGRQTQKLRNREKVDQNRSYVLESNFIEIMTKPIRTKSYPLQSNFMKRGICGRISLNQTRTTRQPLSDSS